MPLPAPSIDNRRYGDLLNEALARIPVHTPEWTNFGPADPGVTLIEVFAFLTENLLYRANQIPDRNRRKFLDLLGVPLAPATSARGLVAIANDSGEMKVQTVQPGLEARAGEIPFFTEAGLDVLPLEAQFYLKRPYADESGARTRYYNMLYASLKQEQPGTDTRLELYETVAWNPDGASVLALNEETVDGYLWMALLARKNDDTGNVRKAIAGKTLSLGIVPAQDEKTRRLQPRGGSDAAGEAPLKFEMPRVPVGGKLSPEPQPRKAEYRSIEARSRANLLEQAGIVELSLPSAPEMELWQDLDPLESGSGNFPPSLDDTAQAARVITWIRISAPGAVRLLWAGINAATILQRQPVAAEVLSDGTGEPDQQRQLAHPPVLLESVRISVSNPSGEWDRWERIDDLLAAPPEVQPAYSFDRPRAETIAERGSPDVFAVDPESGVVRFGDGLRGRRPHEGALIRAWYDRSHGLAGNVARGAINTCPALHGCKIANPVPTWGGASSEDADEAQKQIPRFIQHRDRLVTAADFEAITLRTPGVQIGRVEVLPAFNPDLVPDAPGNAPGAVTLMLVPDFDPIHPDAPEPSSHFVNAVCKHLDARRLVTTEVILRGPEYRDIWIAIGIELLADGRAGSEVREAVRDRIRRFLAPLRRRGLGEPEFLTDPDFTGLQKGWPLRCAVSAAELMAQATRVPGVRFVRKVLLMDSSGVEMQEVPMSSLQLPRIAGIEVVTGDAPSPSLSLMGEAAAGGAQQDNLRIVPVPIIPERC